MGYSVTDFKSAHAGGARQHDFEIEFLDKSNELGEAYSSLVSAPGSGNGKGVIRMINDNISLVKSTAVPGFQQNVLDVKWKGHHLKYPGERTYSDWTADFYISGDKAHQIYDFFVLWLDYLTGFTASKNGEVDISRYSDISKVTVDAEIRQLNFKRDGYLGITRLIGIMPTNIGQMQFDAGSSELMTFSVTFSVEKAVRVTDYNEKCINGVGPYTGNTTIETECK